MRLNSGGGEMVFIAAAIGDLGRESTAVYRVLLLAEVWWTLVFGAWAGRSGEDEASLWLREDGCNHRLNIHIPLNFECLDDA